MPNDVNIAELRALMEQAPQGPFDVDCYERGEGPDRSLIVFIRDADERPVLVDEGPYEEDGDHPSPLACLVADALNSLPALLTIAERAATARNDALREAADYHEREIAQLKAQIVANDEYAERIGHPKGTGAANDHCKYSIRRHQYDAAQILSLIKEPTDAA